MQSAAGPSSSMDDIKTMNLHIPDPNKLKEVLECGLREKDFTEINLEWVDCPNLTQEPFNLAAPRICGNTAVLDIGDFSYWRPKPDLTKEYDIGKLLKSLNYNYKNFFIFGNGFAYRPVNPRHVNPNQVLGELVMNQSFLPSHDRVDPNVNKNRFTYMTGYKKCDVQMFENPDTIPKCCMKGTFFVCEGIKSKVLKIHAKADSSIVKSPFDFIDSMQNALYVKHGRNRENIVLGGIYKVDSKYGWCHLITRNDWRSSFATTKYYCKVGVSEAIISIFNSSTETRTPHCPGSPSTKLNAIQSTHCLSHQYADNLHQFYKKNGVVEYTGYFSPAQKLFRVDEPII